MSLLFNMLSRLVNNTQKNCKKKKKKKEKKKKKIFMTQIITMVGSFT